MKRKRLLILLFALAFSATAWVQTQTVTGTVTGSDDGLGIPRVNIMVKGTTQGVTTDLEGKYSIQVVANETLVFTFIGYTTQEVLVGNQSVINISLQPDYTELGEVVIVGL